MFAVTAFALLVDGMAGAFRTPAHHGQTDPRQRKPHTGLIRRTDIKSPRERA